MLTQATPQYTLLRVVKANPPTIDDFKSREDQRLPPLPWHPELNDGISAFDTEERARRKARELPQLGGYIAEFYVSPDWPVRRRIRSSPGHFTVWAAPEELLAAVVRVVPVR